MKKKNLLPILIIVLIIASLALVYFSGMLVTPSNREMGTYTAVENKDILDFQYKREMDILKDYEAGTYTLQNPYVIQDPYQANPLSAVIIFETDQPSITQIFVEGKDDLVSFNYTYQQPKTHHEIAVLGLYPDSENTVRITVNTETGDAQSVDLQLKTEALPIDFPTINVEVSQPELMEPGVTLMIPCFETNYTYLLDANGDVRAYFSYKSFGHGTAMRMLENGRLLVTGDVMKIMPYNMHNLWEMNLLGKVFKEYEIPNAIHHDIIELENGDFLATSNNVDMPLNYDTREDVIIQIDRTTGLVTKEHDLRAMLDENRSPYHHFDPNIENAPSLDWAHLNSVEFDYDDNGIIASSPIQSAIVKFNSETDEIQWILSAPENWDTEYHDDLLTPLEPEDFEWMWGQHAVKILPDEDNNPDTIDLLVFDNGQVRSYSEESGIAPENNYSRAVIYRVDEKKMTVEQLWQYGKERGSEAYSTFLGSSDYLPETENILSSFGGMLRKDGIPVDSIIDGVLGKQQIVSRVIEVQQSGEPVFEVFMTPNNKNNAETYQARRIELYTSGIDYSLGQLQAQQFGEVQSARMEDITLLNFFINRFDFSFTQLYEKDGYLIYQGYFFYQDEAYLLGRMNMVLKNRENEYIFQGNSGINGNIYGRIDLSQLEPGEYAIYAIGGVIEGNDVNGKIKPGYNPTGYKITVE